MPQDSQTTELPPIGVLSTFDADELAHFARFGKPVEVASREIVIRQGDTRDTIDIILTGKVRVYRRTPAGVETTLAELGPGETLGDMSFFDKQPAVATVQASGGTNLWRLTREEFDRFSTNHPAAAYKLTRQIAVTIIRRLRRAVQTMTDQGHSVNEGWW